MTAAEQAIAAVERVRELIAVGHHYPPRGQGWLVALGMRCYLDDAGSQTNAKRPIFALGGWIASRSLWEGLTWNWEMIREVKKAPIYHAKDAEFPPWGDFREFIADCATDDEAKRKLISLKSALAGAIRDHKLVGVGRGVHVPDYNEMVLSAEWAKQRTEREKFLPVCLCLSVCLEWIGADWPHRPPGEDITVVLADGTLGLGAAIEYFWWLKKKEKPFWMEPFLTITTGPKEMPPLQAADMLAHEAYKHFERYFTWDPPRLDGEERELLKVLCRDRRVTFKYGDRETFAAMAEKYQPWVEGTDAEKKPPSGKQ